MTTNKPYLLKAIVGTANFGLAYGATNGYKVLSQEECHGIMQTAWESGIIRLDTAQAYGPSESVINAFSGSRFEVITKIGRWQEFEIDWDTWLLNQVNSALKNVSRHNLTTVLFHDSTPFLKRTRDKALQALKFAQKKHPQLIFGVSIYDPTEWEQLKDVPQLKVFQVPFNVFDQRFETSGAIYAMFKMGKIVHTRSPFLQGLLVTDPHNLPPYFTPWLPLFKKWQSHCVSKGLSPVGAAAGFAMKNPFVSGVIFGVNSRSQLEALIAELPTIPFNELSNPDFVELPAELIDPRRWFLN